MRFKKSVFTTLVFISLLESFIITSPFNLPHKSQSPMINRGQPINSPADSYDDTFEINHTEDDSNEEISINAQRP